MNRIIGNMNLRVSSSRSQQVEAGGWNSNYIYVGMCLIVAACALVHSPYKYQPKHIFQGNT